MREVEKNIDTERTHRRKGAAFDRLAHIWRDVRSFIFQNDFTINNRPGRELTEEGRERGFVFVRNMFEMFFRTPSTDGINGVTIGRQGDGLNRNTHLVQIEPDHRTEIGHTQGYVNGIFRVRTSRDGQDEDNRSGLYIMDAGTEREGFEGTVTQLVASGSEGEVRLTYNHNKEDAPGNGVYDIYISRRGILMYGLPTSPAGLLPNTLWRDGDTIKIV